MKKSLPLLISATLSACSFHEKDIRSLDTSSEYYTTETPGDCSQILSSGLTYKGETPVTWMVCETDLKVIKYYWAPVEHLVNGEYAILTKWQVHGILPRTQTYSNQKK